MFYLTEYQQTQQSKPVISGEKTKKFLSMTHNKYIHDLIKELKLILCCSNSIYDYAAQ